MPHDPSGSCVVCGILTTQRCSSCAEHGFDLFLYGREHQKLIWFAHRRVCEVNSTPFRFPPLTAEEVEEAIRRKDDEFVNGWSNSAILCAVLGIPNKDVNAFLTTLGRSQHPYLEQPHLQGVITFVRSVLYRLATHHACFDKNGNTIDQGCESDTHNICDPHAVAAYVVAQIAFIPSRKTQTRTADSISPTLLFPSRATFISTLTSSISFSSIWPFTDAGVR